MRRFFLLLSVSLITFTVFAQQPTIEVIKKRFNLSLGIFNDSWRNVPDSIPDKKLNIGFEVAGLYNFPMDHKNKFFFFVGAGISSHSLKHNALIGQKKIADGVWDSYFYNIPSHIGSIPITHKVSKLVLTYFDVPFGFRYDFPSKFQATLGFKVGWRLKDYWKYNGSYYNASNTQFITGQQVLQKNYKMLNLADMHYGPYASFAYKWLGVSVYYQLSSIYNQDRGPKLAPVSIGLTFRPVR